MGWLLEPEWLRYCSRILPESPGYAWFLLDLQPPESLHLPGGENSRHSAGDPRDDGRSRGAVGFGQEGYHFFGERVPPTTRPLSSPQTPSLWAEGVGAHESVVTMVSQVAPSPPKTVPRQPSLTDRQCDDVPRHSRSHGLIVSPRSRSPHTIQRGPFSIRPNKQGSRFLSHTLYITCETVNNRYHRARSDSDLPGLAATIPPATEGPHLPAVHPIRFDFVRG